MRCGLPNDPEMCDQVFENYQKLDGKIKNKKIFIKRLAAFLEITMGAFTDGKDPWMDREESWAAWMGYLRYHRCTSEANKIFEAVDMSYPYS